MLLYTPNDVFGAIARYSAMHDTFGLETTFDTVGLDALVVLEIVQGAVGIEQVTRHQAMAIGIAIGATLPPKADL
jgi:hypothetical protein